MALIPVSAPEFQLAFAQETTFGTPNTTEADFFSLHEPENAEVDLSGLTQDSTPRMDGTNVPQNTDNFITQAGGIVVQPFSAIATRNTLSPLLYGVMQDLVSEQVGTPFEKIWEWDDATTRPDLSVHDSVDDAGIFFTVVAKNALASEDQILTSCVIPSLTISSDPTVAGGRMMVSGNFMSGFSSLYDESGSQAIVAGTAPDQNYYHHCLMVTKTFGAAPLIVGSWDMTLINKAVRIGCDTVGDAENYMFGANKYEATGNIRVLYEANTKGIITNFLTSAFDTPLVFAWGTGADPVTTTGDLLFKFNVYPQQPVKDFTAEEGTMVDIPVICVSDGTNEMVEIEHADANDEGWTA